MTTDEIMALADEYSDAHLQMVTQGGLDPLVFRDSLQSAIEALQADAARYRWLRDHECNSLYLTRNDEHAANYMTAKDWIREHQEDFQDDDQAEVSRMKETNTIWTLQIYPHTPIGFNLWHGSTPDVAIDAAMALDKP